MSRAALCFFFFHRTARPELYSLSLHDALPISPLADLHAARRVLLPRRAPDDGGGAFQRPEGAALEFQGGDRDRKSTRLNSSHANISYAVFCLKKKKRAVSFP